MATPESGMITMVGNSGRTYHIGVYVSDVVGNRCNLDVAQAPGSTSPQDWLPPENGFIVDAALTTGVTATTFLQVMEGGGPVLGGMIYYAAQLTSINNRPPIRIPVLGGVKLEIVQR